MIDAEESWFKLDCKVPGASLMTLTVQKAKNNMKTAKPNLLVNSGSLFISS